MAYIDLTQTECHLDLWVGGVSLQRLLCSKGERNRKWWNQFVMLTRSDLSVVDLTSLKFFFCGQVFSFNLGLWMLNDVLIDGLQPGGGTPAPPPADTHTDSRPCWVTIVPGCGGCSVRGPVWEGGLQEPESFQLHFLLPSLRAPTQRSCCCGISGAPEGPLVRLRRRRYHKEDGQRRRVSNLHLIYWLSSWSLLDLAVSPASLRLLLLFVTCSRWDSVRHVSVMLLLRGDLWPLASPKCIQSRWQVASGRLVPGSSRDLRRRRCCDATTSCS